MNVFDSAINNLKRHPAAYTVIALVLVLASVLVPQLPESDRLYGFIVSVVVAALSVVFLHVKSNGVVAEPESTGKNTVVEFQAPPSGKYNYPFYDYFIEQITTAREDIVITGDGFECTNTEGTNIAKRFAEAFRVALANNVSIVRIETKSRGQMQWAEMLAGLVEQYGDQFQLYILREKKATQMASVCVIDPEIPEAATVEIMLSTQRLFGVKAADLAGTAVFIHQQPYLAQDLRRRVLNLRNSEYSIHPLTPTEVVNALADEAYYFSFASNMKSAQMKSRCPSAQQVGIGVLQDHEIVFNRRGSYRPGGVASVQQCEGKRVYGVIWKLNPAEFAELDNTEDLAAYRRFEEKIQTLDGTNCQCYIYKAIPQGIFQPDPDYLKLVIEASKEQQLPEDYIQYLKSFQA